MNTKLKIALTSIVAIGLITSCFCAARIRADEGMWLFNAVPKAQLKVSHNFEPTQPWLDHVMLSSVRFNSGGSASFVSSQGLVLLNHHVASDTLYKLSTAERNYNEDGFLAATMADEIKTPNLELNQLISIEDVTAVVNAAIKDSSTLWLVRNSSDAPATTSLESKTLARRTRVCLLAFKTQASLPPKNGKKRS